MIQRLETATRGASTNPYQVERLVVHALDADGLDPQQVRNGGPWPLDIAPGEMPEQVVGFPCATIEGDEAEQLADVLSDADAMTTWTHDNSEYRLLARPLLPHQDGC